MKYVSFSHGLKPPFYIGATRAPLTPEEVGARDLWGGDRIRVSYCCDDARCVSGKATLPDYQSPLAIQLVRIYMQGVAEPVLWPDGKQRMTWVDSMRLDAAAPHGMAFTFEETRSAGQVAAGGD